MLVSLSQPEYSVVESNNSLIGTITLNNEIFETLNVIVEVTISDGSANGNVE